MRPVALRAEGYALSAEVCVQASLPLAPSRREGGRSLSPRERVGVRGGTRALIRPYHGGRLCGEGNFSLPLAPFRRGDARARGATLPLPSGEGWSEGGVVRADLMSGTLVVTDR